MPNELGKRFRCEACNSEVLITKAGDGGVECCDKRMEMQQPRPLPSSD
ncbi:desulfoferrodoxin [Dehalococcoidia bacterium]|nr:desulfoferrodoxin [Dehalococcoidia bacterium]MCL0079765.1 desulfoferrodoxin [Dehalococcoidia bacterium]